MTVSNIHHASTTHAHASSAPKVTSSSTAAVADAKSGARSGQAAPAGQDFKQAMLDAMQPAAAQPAKSA